MLEIWSESIAKVAHQGKILSGHWKAKTQPLGFNFAYFT